MHKPNGQAQENFAGGNIYNHLKVKASDWLNPTNRPLLACLLITLASLLLFAPALRGEFLGDDFACVKLYHNPKWLEWPKLFYSEWSQGIWGFQLPELRPFIALLFMFDGVVWQTNPFGYHLTNILIHSLNSVLLFFVVRALSIGNIAAAIVAGLLFAVHPVHVEPVYIVSGRTDLLPASFLLGSFLAFIFYRSQNKVRYYVISLIFYAMGLYSKEIIIPLPGILIVYDFLIIGYRDRKLSKILLCYLPYGIVLGAYLYLRKSIFGSTVLAPISLLEFWERQSTYLNSLFPPLNIQKSWVWVLIYLLVGLGAVLGTYFRRKLTGAYIILLFFGIAWYLISIMPLIVTYLAPRHLYIASMGTCVMLALAGQRLLPKRIFLLVTLFVLTYYSIITSQYISQSDQVSAVSRISQQKVEKLALEAPKGSVLIVDIPGYYNRDRLWAWSSPFVFQKPFRAVDAEEHFNILERPENYYTYDFAWRKINTIKNLTQTPFDGNMLYLSDEGEVKVKKIDKLKLQLMLTEFIDKWKDQQPPAPNELWMTFWHQYYKS